MGDQSVFLTVQKSMVCFLVTHGVVYSSVKCLPCCTRCVHENHQAMPEGAIAVFHDQRYVGRTAGENNRTGEQHTVAPRGSDDLGEAVVALACGDTGMAAAAGDFGG